MESVKQLFACDICGQKNFDSEEMKAHMLLVHREESPSCPFCSLSGITADEMQIHINIVHEDVLNPAKLPVNRVTNGFTAANEINEPGVSGNQTCSSKKKMTLKKSKSDIDVPNEYVTGNSTNDYSSENTNLQNGGRNQKEDILVCPICNESAISSSALQLHLQFAHEEGPQMSMFLCPICSASFKEARLLEVHVETHFDSDVDLALAAIQNLSHGNIAQQSSSESLAATTYSYNGKENNSNASLETVSLENVDKMVDSNPKTPHKNQTSAVKGQRSITDFFRQNNGAMHGDAGGTVDDNSTCNRHILNRLERYYQNHKAKITLSQYYLSSETDHYGVAYFDRNWGCGYRNIQMILSSLLKNPIYEGVLSSKMQGVPSVLQLQVLIESAWENGFDPAGREQLGGKLHSKTTWIGATEAVALLSWLRIKCHLVDFFRPTGTRIKHPQLIQWVKNYYMSNEPFKPPLYLQHQGHSRSIVGIEVHSDGRQILLIFDPSKPKRLMKEITTITVLNDTLLANIRCPEAELNANQYQVVAVTGIIQPDDLDEYKLLHSERIP